ncbi:MAG: HEAT repeat domain-containing protein [Candidatus Aminicenantes bacterium]|jgi:HEAT repeat protein
MNTNKITGKKQVFIITIITFTCMFYMPLLIKGKPNSQPGPSQGAETVQIILKESYGTPMGNYRLPIDSSKVRLPIKEILEKLLALTGLRQVDANADILLKVVITGQAQSRTYGSLRSPMSKTQRAYSGASISGEIHLREGERWHPKKSFYGKVVPKVTIRKRRYESPSSAPFGTAFLESSFVRDMMELLTGINRDKIALLAAYLQSDESRIRKEAVAVLGESKDVAAVNLLLTALNDKAYDVRLKAVKELEKIKAPNSVDPLINCLKDKNNLVRDAVRQALNTIEPNWIKRESCQQLVPNFIADLESSSSSTRSSAVEALGELSDPRALEPLMMLLMDKDSFLRKKVVRALDKSFPQWRTSQQAAALVPDFIAGLEKQSPRIRAGAADALEEIGDPRGFHPLIKALKDKDNDVRWGALNALNKSYPHWGSSETVIKDVPYFLKALQSSDEKTRGYAVNVLEGIKDPRVIPALVEALKDNNRWVRIEVVHALANIDDPGVVQPLIALLQGKDPSSRVKAAKALAKTGDPRAIAPLLSALKNPDSLVVEAAAEALGELNATQAVTPLIDLCKNKNNQVSDAAFEALAKMKDSVPLEPFVEFLTAKDSKLSSSAQNFLEKINKPGKVDLLIASLNSEDSTLRITLINMLGKLKDRRAVGPLIEILQSPKTWERDLAARALKAITGKDYGVKYKKWQKWWKKNNPPAGGPFMLRKSFVSVIIGYG